jgi:hypothetical protein
MVSCDLNGDKIFDSLAIAFAGAGLNVFNGTNWTYLNPNIPEDMISFNGNGLIIDFGGLGLYRWTVGAANLQPLNKDGVMPNPVLLGPGRSTNSLTISLPGAGTWIYDGAWTQLNPNPVGVVNAID